MLLSGQTRFAGLGRDRLGSGMMPAPHKPLSALLSQILVAYTVELDGEFERRMLETQSRSARLSLVLWLNVLRFLADGPVSVRTLASRALTAEEWLVRIFLWLQFYGLHLDHAPLRKLARQTEGGAPMILPGDVALWFESRTGRTQTGNHR